MLAKTHSASLLGIEALPVQVEVNTGLEGDPRVCIVGLPDASVRESQDRVHSALINSGHSTPHTRATVNLAPGDLRKEGPSFDLPIALGLLAATGQMRPEPLADYLIAGELALSGETRPVKGGLPTALLARTLPVRGVLLPPKSAVEAALVDSVPIYPVSSLAEARSFLEGDTSILPIDSAATLDSLRKKELHSGDFSDIKGQHTTRRAVEIAVAGGHNLLMIGPPGSGKSMIAKRIPTIMPDPTLDEYLEILSIHSAAGISLGNESLRMARPFRAPHHTISDIGLLGGGAIPGPGEISLAHHGVLFLDELPEFKRSTLEVLRQPLEDGQVTISRSRGKITLPCSFMLVAAMNPTPCGYDGKSGNSMRSTPAQIQRYRSRISGPLLDRIDLHVDVPALGVSELRNQTEGESSATMRQRIENARAIQNTRFRGTSIHSNAGMQTRDIRKHCRIQERDGIMLEQSMEQLHLSARAYDRILKVARTIADLERSPDILSDHLFEAIQFRSLDRQIFA